MKLDASPVRLASQWRWQGDRLVVFSDASFNIQRVDLNLVGGMVWELSNGSLSGAEIATEIGRVFPDVALETLQDAVGRFLDELEALWLLTSTEALAAYE